MAYGNSYWPAQAARTAQRPASATKAATVTQHRPRAQVPAEEGTRQTPIVIGVVAKAVMAQRCSYAAAAARGASLRVGMLRVDGLRAEDGERKGGSMQHLSAGRA